VPPLTARVNDLTNTLDAQQRSALEQTLGCALAQEGRCIGAGVNREDSR